MARPYRAADSQFVFQHRESRAEFFQQRRAIREPFAADFPGGFYLSRGEHVIALARAKPDNRRYLLDAPKKITCDVRFGFLDGNFGIFYIRQATRLLQPCCGAASTASMAICF
jgi:hypothetical protein